MGRHSSRPDSSRGSDSGRPDRLGGPGEGDRETAGTRRAARSSRADSRPSARGGSRPAGRSSRDRSTAGQGPADEFDFEYSINNRRRAGSLEKAPVGLRVKLERKKARRKQVALISLVSVVGALLVGAVGGFAYLKYVENKMQKGMNSKTDLAIELEKAGPQEPYNLLILGYDKRHDETRYRSDTMLLARVDPVSKKVWLISLPRDYRVEIPGEGVAKLNAAYSIGEEELAIKTVEKLTGQTINHYMGVSFDGFASIVDGMGGVEIDVPVAINDPKADYTIDNSAAVVDAGLQTLDGKHALTFVRSRAYPDADFSRMKNQQAFFMAVADQVANKVSLAKLMKIVGTTMPYLRTDMSLIDLARTARDLKSAGSKNIYTATLPGAWRSPYIYPDEEAKAALLTKFEQGVPFVEVKDPEVTTDPAKVTVDVRNGTTQAGLAKQAAAVLKARGFVVGEVGNTANQSVYDTTTIVYKTDEAARDLVAKYLASGVKMVQSKGMYEYDSEILVIIGRDWDISKLPVAEVVTK